MHVTKANVMDGLASASVLIMGEGNEQTPMAIITDINFVEFCDNNPSQEELDDLNIKLEDDLYYPILKNAGWIDKNK
jgi:F420-0:gamma-glutamyl ligase